MSAELSLLVACEFADDEALAGQVADAGPQFDWWRFEKLAAYHGLAGLALERLAQAAPGAMSTDTAHSMRRKLQGQAALQMIQTAESVNLTRLLAAAGIRSIVLKGMAIAHLLYAESPASRGSTDIDLLIAEADLFEADRLLCSAGYVRSYPEGALPERGLDMLLNLANVFNYISPASGITLELHFRPTLNPHVMPVSFDRLFAATAVIETGSGQFSGLDGPLHLAYLCIHAIGHSGYRLKWFADIARALRRAGETSCAGCVARASLDFAVRPAQEADSVLAALDAANGGVAADASRAQRRGVNRVLQDMEDRSTRGSRRSLRHMPEEIAELTFRMRIAPGIRARAHTLLCTLSDPRDAFALRLGRHHGLIYAVAGPVLSLARYLRR